MSFSPGIFYPYRSLSSPLHRMDVRGKLLGTLIYIFTCALLPPDGYANYLILLVILYGLVWLSQVGFWYVIKRSLLVLPFMMAALPLPFTSGGNVFSILQSGGLKVSIYTSGLVQLSGILLKSLCSVQVAILLVSTTPLSDLLIGLRKLGIPRLLVVVTGLMWRYLSLSMDEAKSMIRARLSRSSVLKESPGKIGGSLAWRGKVTGMMVGSLLVRSLERSERVYAAMLARGFDGEPREPGTAKQPQDGIDNSALDPAVSCKNIGDAKSDSDLDVEIDGISYTYPDGRLALCDINLKIRAGEKIALLGMNGAGKSTLLWHLNGLLPGDHRAGSTGLVRVCGLDVREPMLKRVRAMVGLVFQNPDDQLFSPSVYEDIAYAPIYQGLTAEQVRETVFASLRGVGMEDYFSRVPYHLSSGEKKRIAIAAVLASKPVVLALDEPTAGLDPSARRSLIDLLEGLPQSMLVATHDLSLAARMLPRSIILYKGMVVADSRTDSLLQDHRLLEQYGLV